MFEHLPDRQLVPLARHDPQAFEALMRRHLPRMHAVACGMVGESQADDVLQEVLWSTHQNLKKFRGEAEFSTWLYRITMNACYQALRKPGKHNLSLDNPDFPLHEFPAADSVHHRAEQQEVRAIIEEGMQHLPPDQREAFSLRELLDMDYQQISEVLGVQLGTVKSRISRARQSLKVFLLKRGVQP